MKLKLTPGSGLRWAAMAAVLLWVTNSFAQYISPFSEPESQSQNDDYFHPNSQPITISPFKYEPIVPVRSFQSQPDTDYYNRQYEVDQIRAETRQALEQERYERQAETRRTIEQERYERQRDAEEQKRQFDFQRDVDKKNFEAELQRSRELEAEERNRELREERQRDYNQHHQSEHNSLWDTY